MEYPCLILASCKCGGQITFPSSSQVSRTLIHIWAWWDQVVIYFENSKYMPVFVRKWSLCPFSLNLSWPYILSRVIECGGNYAVWPLYLELMRSCSFHVCAVRTLNHSKKVQPNLLENEAEWKSTRVPQLNSSIKCPYMCLRTSWILL